MLGEDFTEPSPLQVTFFGGNMINDTACVTMGITNDNTVEFDHDFSVSLGRIIPSGPAITHPVSTTISINDDEGRIQCVVKFFILSNWIAT